MMLGYLLARAGIDTMVVEKHADFLRDFRGDTIHPSTLELMHELGILDEFLERPHQEVRELGGQLGDELVTIADFSHLPTRCKFIAFMPQWDFLDFIADHARPYPTFRLAMQTEALDLIEEAGRTVGLKVRSPDGPFEIRAALTVGADGRHSVVRERARLVRDTFGAPMDVLWLRLSRKPSDPEQTLGRIAPGRMLVMINRTDYWQCGYLIRKGGFEEIKARGLDELKSEIVKSAPFVGDRTGELSSWDNVELLTVSVDRLRQWHRPGLLCIGDAAHAMSPVGGVGINLAIQDAVAAANLLHAPLARGAVTDDDLAKVQRRRELPTRLTQRLQVVIQNRVIERVLASRRALSVPFPFTLLRSFPVLRRIPARLIGMGFRPEHIASPARVMPRALDPK
jgi:2-polyprenyl-6-methoxyphenol hydroxylase-like FAD-dependent oxidoreductase